MASVFTYDPDPPRVSSPWATPPVTTPRLKPTDAEYQLGGLAAPQPALLADCGITKLDAEPQEGPTEYKLHLLLRPRRSFSSSSTGRHVSGSYQSRSRVSKSESTVPTRLDAPSLTPVPNLQARQNRLQHLTTQLLWRLQQSSPYHSSSTADLVLPVLPEAASKLGAPRRPGKLLPGLEDSHGALYEIGVSDDGTFVGLTKDEMDESLTNLRAMAASLGCRVEIQRTVIVGECEPGLLGPPAEDEVILRLRTERLWVAEVLVLPDTTVSLQADASSISPFINGGHALTSHHRRSVEDDTSQTEQLRVSLTGGTTSGKSSLLGTLSTSTLDNGRGKSRLSLLKHRHEIASGVTSSVAPELIGYKTSTAESTTGQRNNNVVNYGCGNVSSWIDIHNAAEKGRLVFLTDSAGHPRYRRTTVRGLVSWAPHWTLCCIAADDGEDIPGVLGGTASAEEVLGSAGVGIDLSKAHLELCLKLNLPLVVVITKYDLASRGGLRQTLAKVLSTVKDAGRQPVMLKRSLLSRSDLDLQSLLQEDEDEVDEVLATVGDDFCSLVPIVLTSAVTGSGISNLHALLRHLRIPQTVYTSDLNYPDGNVRNLDGLFHVDEVFARSDRRAYPSTSDTDYADDSIFVLSGHLRYGNLSIGQICSVGPFAPTPLIEEPTLPEQMHRARSYPSHLSRSLGTPKPAKKRLRPLSGDYPHENLSVDDGTPLYLDQEWQQVRIVSLRNLRLPVRKLLAGQVGTIGIEFTNRHASLASKMRKGMILVRHTDELASEAFTAYAGFRALFRDQDYLAMEPGALFSVYVASVRATAKILLVEMADRDSGLEMSGFLKPVDELFRFDDSGGQQDQPRAMQVEPVGSKKEIEVTFRFVSCREWIEVGKQVLVMPGSGAEGSVGLDGYVGVVVQGLE